MSARKATAYTKKWLREHGLPADGVRSETVSFADLARDSKVFVSVPSETYRLLVKSGLLEELKEGLRNSVSALLDPKVG